ncbi:unnamed protein product [Rhodiola kirilowii]
MAPRKAKKSPQRDGIFSGMVVYLVESGVQARRIQIWRQRLEQMGGVVEEKFSNKVTHVFGVDFTVVGKEIGDEKLQKFKGSVLSYRWLEETLKLGERAAEDLYYLKMELEVVRDLVEERSREATDGNESDGQSKSKKIKRSTEDEKVESKSGIDESVKTVTFNAASPSAQSPESPKLSVSPLSAGNDNDNRDKTEDSTNSSLPYKPPDLNKNITEIFGKLINIYRALGDDRRSFSYHKAISVIEKVPFKIESADQVKDLPTIGKAMKEHIQEIVTTGKLSKLEHFETDEKVRTISLFGEVWGIGPATALKLYEKGHRTLEDLKNESSLTYSQQIGLKYFDDIKTRIPRQEVQEMEQLLQRIGEELLPGVMILCGGSYRRGKPTCGDMDIIITHPDGKSHKGFLSRFVKCLKEKNFLREDLVFTTHSEEGTDSGVDTYFGLCTYPGRELRNRIDLKVYPREIYAFGLIAWTGNDVLNRRLRIIADSKGYRLDDTGLFLATQSSGGKRGAKGARSMSFKTEKEVFDFLGFPWLEPHERNL